ncbi:MAG TPA: DnaJ C-terminal domain-containing protein [Steroidobacteraceae bacterium]|nr:DnaJ C-terminal domain-containing protein [Steroidobacteraceae bacterium]
MQYKDYYATLGVSRDAGADDIKKAFRKLARKYHPDVSKEKDAEKKMQEINEAYAVLSDAEKRAAYDQLGRNYQSGQDFQPPPDWDSGFEFSGRDFSGQNAGDFSDFFSQLFGGMGGSRGFRGAGMQMRGEDHHAKVTLDIEDSFSGATKQISLRTVNTDAQGRPVVTPRTLNVKIPVGVTEGQTIRLAGQGSTGFGGGPSGDLLLQVQFHPHDRLRVTGRDLHLVLRVAPWEAALGCVLPIALPNGEIKVRVPANAQSGQQLRVRGKGLPSNPPGDLLLDIQVILPPADTDKARQFYESMARELAFNPRTDRETHHA